MSYDSYTTRKIRGFRLFGSGINRHLGGEGFLVKTLWGVWATITLMLMMALYSIGWKARDGKPIEKSRVNIELEERIGEEWKLEWFEYVEPNGYASINPVVQPSKKPTEFRIKVTNR